MTQRDIKEKLILTPYKLHKHKFWYTDQVSIKSTPSELQASKNSLICA